MWHPDAWINKGIKSAQPVPAGPANYSAKMAALAQLNSTTSHASFNRPGWNTLINGSVMPLYIVPTPDHPRAPVYVYKTAAGKPAAWPPASAYPGALQKQLASVPVPLGEDMSTPFETFYGKPLQEVDVDRHVAIWDPFTDEYWDFEGFKTLHSTDGAAWQPPAGVSGVYYACSNGGYISGVEHAAMHAIAAGEL